MMNISHCTPEHSCPACSTQVIETRLEQVLKRQPRFAKLNSRLLSHGGRRVVAVPEPHLDMILGRGQLWSGAGLITREGEPCHCHANTAGLWFLNRSQGFLIVTGWALSDDGLWRQHSWGWQDNHVIETTYPRIMYYGFPLALTESLRFVSANLLPYDPQALDTALSTVSRLRPLLGNAAQGVNNKRLQQLLDDFRRDCINYCSSLTLPSKPTTETQPTP